MKIQIEWLRQCGYKRISTGQNAITEDKRQLGNNEKIWKEITVKFSHISTVTEAPQHFQLSGYYKIFSRARKK